MEKTKKTVKKTVSSIFVKVARTGTAAQEIALNGSRTIADALEVAGLNKKASEVVQVNGEEVEDLTLKLEEGDRIVLIKNISGGGD